MFVDWKQTFRNLKGKVVEEATERATVVKAERELNIETARGARKTQGWWAAKNLNSLKEKKNSWTKEDI